MWFTRVISLINLVGLWEVFIPTDRPPLVGEI
jgi:hypothetical protein